MAWLVTPVGLYVLAVPFIFGSVAAGGTYGTSLIVAGLIVAVLAAYRAWQPDEKVPLPLLPLVVILLGLYSIAAPFLFGGGVGDTVGITLVIAGLVFIVLPAMMINQYINKQQGTPPERSALPPFPRSTSDRDVSPRPIRPRSRS